MLSQFYNLATKLLPPGIVSAAQQQRLRALSERLPPFHWIGFEFSLRSSERVDFHQGIKLEGTNLRSLSEHLAADSVCDKNEILLQFLTRLSDADPPIKDVLDHIVLEIDVVDAAQQFTPSVFLGFSETASPQLIANTCLSMTESLMHGNAPITRNLKRVISSLAEGECISHVAVMLSRQPPVLRLNIRNVTRSRLRPFLQSSGYAHSTCSVEYSFSRAVRLCARITVCLDIADEVLPRIGLECRAHNHFDVYDRFLAELEDWGLADPTLSEPLLRYGKDINQQALLELWPEKLMIDSLLGRPDQLGIIKAHISHIKISCLPDREPNAKCYLATRYKPQELRAATAYRPQHLDKVLVTTRGTVAETLDDAVEQSVSWLLEARHQSGWWRDFPSIPLGFSDEYVTAYVGYVLAGTNNNVTVMAASEAWDLLLEAQRANGGWGWDSKTAADADATSWSLRLGAKLGYRNDPRAKRATSFIDRHQTACGGIASYSRADFEQRHGSSSRVAGLLSFWCEPHDCVSAVAAPLLSRQSAALQYLIEAQQTDGHWISYWWAEPAFPTALAVRTLSRHDKSPDRQSTIEAAVEWVRAKINSLQPTTDNTDASPSAFALANYLTVLLLGGSASDRPTIERVLLKLLALRTADGAWPPSAPLYPRDNVDNYDVVHLDIYAVFTTATVLGALLLYQQIMGESQ